MTRFGASAPFKDIYPKFGFTVENLTVQVGETQLGLHYALQYFRLLTRVLPATLLAIRTLTPDTSNPAKP